MFHKALVLCVLSVLLHRAVADECPLDEFTDVKLLGDGTAVLAGVYTLEQCNTFLVRNKDTHDAVTYDKLTGKCCAAVKGTNYYLGYAQGSITFKQRNESSEHAKTTPYPSWNTTQATSPVVHGACDSGNYMNLALNKVATIALYNSDYDVCYDFPNSMPYYNNLSVGCSFYVTSPDADGFAYMLSYVFGPTDSFYMFTNKGNQSVEIDSMSSAGRSGFLFGNELYLTFETRGPYTKGFCLKVTPKRLSDLSTKKPLTNSTTAPTEHQVYGACDSGHYMYLPLNEKATISIYDSDYDVCYDFPNSMPNYTISMDCSFIITSPDANGFAYTLSYAFGSTDSLYISGNKGGEAVRIGNNTSAGRSGFLFGNELYLIYENYGQLTKGFCLKVTPKRLSDLSTKMPLPENTTLSTSTKTLGVCKGSSHYYISSSSVFTFEPQPMHICYGIGNNSDFYDEKSNCSVSVSSYDDTIGYYYYIEFETETCCDYISLSNSTESGSALVFRGKSSSKGYIQGKVAYISFFSDETINNPGFCLTLAPNRYKPYN